MKTVVIQIGNSDNKLTQSEWADFCDHVTKAINVGGFVVHFSGGSAWNSPWQNACWVIETQEESIRNLRSYLSIVVKRKYNQDSIAFTIGDTEFI